MNFRPFRKRARTFEDEPSEEEVGVFFLVPLIGAGAKAIAKAIQKQKLAKKGLRKATKAVEKAVRDVRKSPEGPSAMQAQATLAQAQAKAKAAQNELARAQAAVQTTKAQVRASSASTAPVARASAAAPAAYRPVPGVPIPKLVKIGHVDDVRGMGIAGRRALDQLADRPLRPLHGWLGDPSEFRAEPGPTAFEPDSDIDIELEHPNNYSREFF